MKSRSSISPMLWDDIVGRTALRDFKADEMIELWWVFLMGSVYTLAINGC